MREIKQKQWVCVAISAGAFGVAGDVKLKSFTESPGNCALYGPLYDEKGQLVLTPQSHRVMTNHIALKALEVKTREAAEALKGTALYISRDTLPTPEDEDDFYYSDLIGLEVKTTTGQRMGKVIAVHEFGAGDMLEIQPTSKLDKKQQSFFQPFTKVGIPKIDLKANRIIINVVEPENGRDPNMHVLKAVD